MKITDRSSSSAPTPPIQSARLKSSTRGAPGHLTYPHSPRRLRAFALRLVLPAVCCGVAVAAPAVADAFCGFYVSGADAALFNNATMVVLMREGTRTVISMQNNYQGPVEDFAMVVPVPVILHGENVKTLAHEVLAHVDELAAPRLVETWEQDPCDEPGRKKTKKMTGRGDVGLKELLKSGAGPRLGVTIEAKFVVGEYDIVILSAEDATGLDTWLRREGYNIPAGAGPLLRPYVEGGMKFFVARVDIDKVQEDAHGRTTLSPLRFHYDSPELRLPVRLGLLNSGGTQDLLVHVLARGKRYELANYPNVTIPTNIPIDAAVGERFGELYAALFDATLAQRPGAAVTEYAWDVSSCDPCPTPPLSPEDIATLGGDVLGAGALDEEPARGEIGDPPLRGRMVRRSFVLTRLHLRYGKDSLAEDLIFREAPPIVGGREARTGDELEKGARRGYSNNFQARYVIRHRWAGPVTCNDPEWGRWGGPPDDPREPPAVETARDLAFARRGAIELATMIKEPIPELGMMVAAPSRTPDPAADKRSASAIIRDSAATRGCACASTGEGTGGRASAALVALLGLVGLRRRRPRAAGPGRTGAAARAIFALALVAAGSFACSPREPVPPAQAVESAPAADALARIDARVAELRQAFAEQTGEPRPADVEWVKLRLSHLVKIDQYLRRADEAVADLTPHEREALLNALAPRIAEVDAAHTRELKGLVAVHGWPRISVFGEKADRDAWLLVQHADGDPNFQRRALDLLAELHPRGETSAKNFAYLFDRVAIGEGRLQRYGTQAECVAGDWKTLPLEQPEAVDSLRASVGLPPLETYVAQGRAICQGVGET